MENLEELFKKFIFSGIGLVSLAKNQLTKTVEEIVEKNKMNAEEGERIIKNFVESAEQKTNEISETVKKIVENTRSGLDFVRKSEVEALKARIKTLEELINKK